MPESDLFASFVDRGALLSHERQLHIAEVVEGHDHWDVDLEAATLAFTFPDRTLVCQTQLLGSAAPGPGSWLWGWANDPVAGGATEVARSLREFGEQNGVPELTTAEIPLGPAGNEPPEAFWYRLVTATCVLVPGWDGYFRAPIGGGTIAPLLVRHPDLALPGPSLPRAARTLGESISMIRVTNHREAVVAYASQRGIPCEWSTASCMLTLPDGALDVTFDQMNRITAITGSTRHTS
ncbi:MAG: hypothetical protein FWE61_07785 [Micrococcales bacterium]|nr:hypothetical protein [Micrococcales bacterium]